MDMTLQWRTKENRSGFERKKCHLSYELYMKWNN